jgi:hypothetical protein
MFEYLTVHDGPVVEGLEAFETVYARDQPQYIPLRTLPGEDGASALSRWTPTDEQRKAIAEGADILLEVIHFHGPLAPVRMAIIKPEGDAWSEWFCATTKGPYRDVFQKLEQGEKT